MINMAIELGWYSGARAFSSMQVHPLSGATGLENGDLPWDDKQMIQYSTVGLWVRSTKYCK